MLRPALSGERAEPDVAEADGGNRVAVDLQHDGRRAVLLVEGRLAEVVAVWSLLIVPPEE